MVEGVEERPPGGIEGCWRVVDDALGGLGGVGLVDRSHEAEVGGGEDEAEDDEIRIEVGRAPGSWQGVFRKKSQLLG